MEIRYLSYDQVADAAAVSLNGKNTIIIASRDVELDPRAAAVWVIGVCCSDGQHCVFNRSVLCQSLIAVLHTDTQRHMETTSQTA